MSRLGKLPIEIPKGVSASLNGRVLTVKGPKGELSQDIHPLVQAKIEENSITVAVKDPSASKEKAFWGLFRTLINNMVVGVSEGFERKLEINGVGYRAALSGRQLNISAGYSHPVPFALPDGVQAQVEGNIITLQSADKQLLGETAARIRKIRKPEPYKGKGIKYAEEVILRKEGKTAGKGDK